MRRSCAYVKANLVCPTGLRVPHRAALPQPEPDGRRRSLLQEYCSVEEDAALDRVTRLPLNATPSRYLNHIKAFFYYIPPCDFAWLHSNYQPCCSTRGFRCPLPLLFYGKWLILHNPNENTAVSSLSLFYLAFPILLHKPVFVWKRDNKIFRFTCTFRKSRYTC